LATQLSSSFLPFLGEKGNSSTRKRQKWKKAMTKREAKGKMLEVVRKRGKGEARLRKIKKAKKGEKRQK
jgi:hypothetical protein